MSSSVRQKKVAAKRRAVIRAMVASLKHGEPREYSVGLVGYYIEDLPYSASSLSVSAHATPNLDLTLTSFVCTAYFPPNTLDPSSVKANGIIQRRSGRKLVSVVPVRLEVKLADIWAVAEFVKGEQHDLFLDAETVKSRLSSVPARTQLVSRLYPRLVPGVAFSYSPVSHPPPRFA